MANESKYYLLGHSDDKDGTPSDELSLGLNDREYSELPSYSARLFTQWLWLGFAAVVVALGLFLGCFFLGVQYGESKTIDSARSPYLKLEYNQPYTMSWNTAFSNVSKQATQAEIDELWDTQIPWEIGLIGISYDEAEDLGLPKSTPWPWDGENKGLYIMNAYHLLHCVRNIYISIQQYRIGTPQTLPYEHILHCLDSLRVEAMCHADDTLRYVPQKDEPGNGLHPGDGQGRMCRDWSKIKKFAEHHDPCFYYFDPNNSKVSLLERFQFCQPDSQYLPAIRKYFGYSDDWLPKIPGGPRELQW